MCASIGLLFGGISSSAANASSQQPKDSVTPQKKLSAAELKEMEDDVRFIHTKYGDFIRVSDRISSSPINSSEVAFTEESATDKTKIIVLDYGVFLRGNVDGVNFLPPSKDKSK